MRCVPSTDSLFVVLMLCRRCLILAPTRELAKQVASEFESVCPSLTVVSFYGGTSINAQVRRKTQAAAAAAAALAAAGAAGAADLCHGAGA